jgi:nitroimidazol reductase NimA-like FMN-containing flavoprotein (pyridoxamine 5'-phosphate oxidase superfamily)
MITSPRIAREGFIEEAPISADSPETTVLDGPACWRRLDGEGVGRLAVATAEGVDIFPLNYLSRHARLYFRSALGTKILELIEHPRVAFEVDGETESARWSVVVRGTVRRLGSDPEILRSGVDTLRSWQPGEKFNYFEIQPEQLTGRLIRSCD